MTFFSFTTRLSPQAARFNFAGCDKPVDIGPNSPNHHKLLMGEYGSTEMPVRFEQRSGKFCGDVLDTSTATLFLISDRLKHTLESENLSGWRVFDVSVSDKNGNPILGYCGLSVTGRSGPIDLTQSKTSQKRLVPNGAVTTFYKGLFIRIDEWDGSDFFLPKHDFGTMVSRRAADVLRAGKFTNLSLRDIREIEIDEFTAKIILSRA